MAVVDDLHISVVQTPVARQATRWEAHYIRWALLVDFCCALAAGVLALLWRFDNPTGGFALPYAIITAALPFIWLGTVALVRAYEPRFFGIGSDEFRRVLQAGVSLTATVAIVAYATKTDLARGYVVIALPTVTLLGLLGRYALRKRLHRMRAQGRCMRRVVAVGHRAAVKDLISQFRRETHHGMQVAAVCLPVSWSFGPVSDIDGVPVLGDFSEVVDAVDRSAADTVAVLACPEMDGLALRRLAWRLEKTGTDLCVAPALMDVAGPRTTIRPVAGLPLLHVEHPELVGGRQLVKSLFDRVAAALALLVLSPVFLVLTVIIRATSHGPALFRQTRVGKAGEEFTVFKFRTMVADAERLRADLELNNEHDGVLFKIKKDPRVTRVGAFLRRYSMDELPQLFNVLFGDMSLVGPRPPLAAEVASYGDDVRRRLVVKPGMTGLWQVSGRADLSWEESVRLDLRYVENWSLALDLQILWKTWSAVVRGSGAY
ncbi:MAG: exopolysaccharide biosynthesis polyprenyl glycosylphosphotransferase [Streptosporangiales bacterium]|nr:exopolysaccharide biosynthesis polyprenyl glycosylphosphotransferase [Streptosporangiales bacterium]